MLQLFVLNFLPITLWIMDYFHCGELKWTSFATLNPKNVGTPPPPLPPAPLYHTYCQLIGKFCAWSKPFITMYNPGQNSWDTKLNEIAGPSNWGIFPFPCPQGCSVVVMHSSFNSTQSTLLGGEGNRRNSALEQHLLFFTRRLCCTPNKRF